MLASSWRRSLTSVLAGGTLACAHNPAPSGWLAPAREAQADPYGAWIVVSRLAGSPDLGGEFLAVERDSVFMLLASGEVRSVPLDSVSRARMAFYNAQWGGLATWTILGSLSTISNGAFLIFTFPAWIIGGSLATAGQSRAPLRRVGPAHTWDAVRMYARFPGGLPANLPRTLPPKLRP